MTPNLDRQIRISKLLSYGFVFTLLPSLSIVSVFIGLKAMRMIKRSDVHLSGIVLAWWCIVVGVINTIIVTIFFVNNYLR